MKGIETKPQVIIVGHCDIGKTAFAQAALIEHGFNVIDAEKKQKENLFEKIKSFKITANRTLVETKSMYSSDGKSARNKRRELQRKLNKRK
jgi:hypothetical protein